MTTANEIETQIKNRLRKQEHDLNLMLSQDPSLTKKLGDFKEVINEMSKDLKIRKNTLSAVASETRDLTLINDKNRRAEIMKPVVSGEELHQTKVKQLMDLEEALRVDKKKLLLILGSILILIFLQLGVFAFL